MADLREIMSANGIDYAEAMDRFEDNEALYRRLAAKFVNDPHYAALEHALSNGDLETARRSAHSLKGVAGNLSFSDLYQASRKINDAINDGDGILAQSLLPAVSSAYERVLVALKAMQLSN